MNETSRGVPPQPPIPPPPGLPGATPAPETTRPSGRRVALAAGLTVFGAMVLVAIVLGFVIHLPYVLISPGSATPLDSDVVTISGAPTYADSPSVLFLTVRVTNTDPTVWRVVRGWLDPDITVEKRSEVVGCLTPQEDVAYNNMLMQQSQDEAKYVALTRLGYSVTSDASRVIVVSACAGAPASNALAVGDQVTAIDDKPVTSPAELGDDVRVHAPGERVQVSFLHSGQPQTDEVVAGKLSSDGRVCDVIGPGQTTTGIACLGVVSQLFVTYHFPIEVRIDTREVGGPSAGLAFTLAIIDDLTSGSLTGGRRVAVTGTISPDGRVGPVGGVEQKAITARTNHVQLMLVPSSEVADARKGAGGLKVVGVDNVDDALDVLARSGGSPVPPAPTTAARS